MVYACKKCGKIYKNNGKWLKKHMIEKCHVMHLKPIELIERHPIDLYEVLNRISKLEFMIKKGKIVKYSDDPIERIKQDEAAKLTDPLLIQYRGAFAECITELKEVLKLRREQLEELEFKDVFIEEI